MDSRAYGGKEEMAGPSSSSKVRMALRVAQPAAALYPKAD